MFVDEVLEPFGVVLRGETGDVLAYDIDSIIYYQ